MSAKSRHGKRPVPPHAYLRKLAYLHKLGAIKPGVNLIDVAHDDFCARLTGGVCRCNPEVRIKLQHGAGRHTTN